MNDADVVFSNLETLLGRPKQPHSLQQEGFYADPDIVVELLRRANVSAVGLANNVNYGGAAIVNSIAFLDAHGIPHSGAGANLEAARRGAVVERDGRRYGFLQRTSVYWPTDHAADANAAGVAPMPGHTAYEAPMYRYSPLIPPVNRPGIPPIVITWADRPHLDEFVDDIRHLRSEVDFLVASIHWGLAGQVLTYMEEIARAAIDAGADVVVGHGPHQILPIAFYRGRPIFYGVGCFSFNTGHLGMSHGDWIGLVASIELAAQEPRFSARLVRHTDANATYFCAPDDEAATLEPLSVASAARGAELHVDGDTVTIRRRGGEA